MGTRNLTMVIADGKTKVAQYGQWDGYPTGQGRTILNFLLSADIDKFKRKLDIVRFFNDNDEKERQSYLKEIGSTDGWVNMDQGKLYDNKFPFDNRDIAGDILKIIMDFKGKEIVLKDSSSFAADSLFCEWAYVVDFDKNTFEIYNGFNKRRLAKKERFASLPADGEYLPIRLKKSYSLTQLPTVKEMVADCEGKRAAAEIK